MGTPCSITSNPAALRIRPEVGEPGDVRLGCEGGCGSPAGPTFAVIDASAPFQPVTLVVNEQNATAFVCHLTRIPLRQEFVAHTGDRKQFCSCADERQRR